VEISAKFQLKKLTFGQGSPIFGPKKKLTFGEENRKILARTTLGSS
jgi:hypothetical protein